MSAVAIHKAVTDAASREGRWRRWISGGAQWHRGRATRPAELAVVVIGLGARENLRAAVESILAQVDTEVIVVNSGGGRPALPLAGLLDRLTLIEIDEPHHAGVARNVGVDASSSDHVAFLAGDCVALPGWVDGRLRLHRRGVRAVGSAMVPADELSDLGLVAHLMLFASRAPRVRSAAAPAYGLSLTRSVFSEVGYFCTARRIGEDSDFLSRLTGRVSSMINPAVQTVHAPPPGWHRFLAEMRGRGVRAARYQAGVRAARRDRRGYLGALGRLWTQRVVLAEQSGAEVVGLDKGDLQRLGPAIRLAATAYVAGVDSGLRRLERAHKVLQHSEATGDPDAARRAVRYDAESVAARLHLFERLSALGLPVEARAELQAAMWLAAFDPQRQERFTRWLVSRGLAAETTAFTDLAKLCAPPPVGGHDAGDDL